ncbi:MAG: glycosyltransferase family 39 protein [Verrucomicrobia bacterium]|nr:glycosyltransferase family 39 protein [Verrucomicrobiota bacterium]
MALSPNLSRQRWLLLALTLFNLFFLLGSRSLNEPDEGRYAEVAREMLELHDWLVPHIWYVPHLDKPPLTYWAVAASMTVFGRNAWAVRLPLALAGLSAVWAVFLLGRALGGHRAGLWSALLLQSSLLYFVMARMLTTDIFLTQFIAWALFCFWRGWRALDALGNAEETERGQAAKRFFAWQLSAWTVLALGFLTKGPIALAVPLAAMSALAVYRRADRLRWKLLLFAALPGLTWLALLVAPWFVEVFRTVPEAFDYMVKGQVAGHILGTTIKNRQGPPFYFFGVLAVGLLPWSPLLGWLWRRAHWRRLSPCQKEGWLFLNAAVLFTFTLFSCMHAKLPAYILPLFPPLAVLLALRWFGLRTPEKNSDVGVAGNLHSRPAVTFPAAESRAERWAWRAALSSPWLMFVTFGLVLRFVFEVTDQTWLWPGWGLALAGLAGASFLGRGWTPERCARTAVALSLLNLWTVAFVIPKVETQLRGNQTLRPLGEALRDAYRPGDRTVCWGRLPQGLPFYAAPVINAAQRPYLGGISFDRPPYEFPGNRERFGPLVLPDLAALGRLLAGPTRVWVVGFAGTYREAQALELKAPLRFRAQVGEWELFANH